MNSGPKSPGKLGRLVLVNLLLSIIAVFVAFLISEAVLRVFMKDEIVIFPRYQTDAQYGEFTIRRLRPNSVFWHTSADGSWKFVTNSKGFRNDKDIPYAKPDGIVRILSLGDSHTQGFEVRQEKTFSAVIERYLLGEDVVAEVINAGVAGFSTAEALVLLEEEGIKYRPDVVVLGFYANDLVDNIKAGIFSLANEGLSVKKSSHIPGVSVMNAINEFGPLRWLSENSYAYSFTFNSAWVYAKQLLKGKARAELVTEYAIPVDQVDDYQVQLMSHLIRRMYAFCKENDIKLVILDIPRVADGDEVVSSVPPELYSVLQVNSDNFVHSKRVFHDFRNVAELHVPHGHRHVSEFTHMMYGIEVARWIMDSSQLH